MKVIQLFEAWGNGHRIVDLRDPDHDPKAMSALAKAEGEGAAAAKIATPKWEALAKKVKSKRTVIEYRPKSRNLSMLSISLPGDMYYFADDNRGSIGISCNQRDLKFDDADKSFIKDTMEKAGRKPYQVSITSTMITFGYFNNIVEPKFEKAVKAIAAYFIDKSKAAK